MGDDPGGIGIPGLDASSPPYMHVTGVAIEPSQQNATFKVDVDQFTTTFAAFKACNPDATSILPVMAHVPDTPRWKKKKPIPWNNRYVTFAGHLRGVTSTLENESVVERFKVDIDNISFLGNYVPIAKPSVDNVTDSPCKVNMISSH